MLSCLNLLHVGMLSHDVKGGSYGFCFCDTDGFVFRKDKAQNFGQSLCKHSLYVFCARPHMLDMFASRYPTGGAGLHQRPTVAPRLAATCGTPPSSPPISSRCENHISCKHYVVISFLLIGSVLCACCVCGVFSIRARRERGYAAFFSRTARPRRFHKTNRHLCEVPPRRPAFRISRRIL